MDEHEDFGLSTQAIEINKLLMIRQLREPLESFGKKEGIPFDNLLYQILRFVRLIEGRAIRYACDQGIINLPAEIYLTILGPAIATRHVATYFSTFLKRPPSFYGNLGEGGPDNLFYPEYTPEYLSQHLVSHKDEIIEETRGEFTPYGYEYELSSFSAGRGAVTAHNWVTVALIINRLYGRRVVDWKKELGALLQPAEQCGYKAKEIHNFNEKKYLKKSLEAMSHEALGAILEHRLVHENLVWQQAVTRALLKELGILRAQAVEKV